MSADPRVDRTVTLAVDYHSQGFNCAEAVLKALVEEFKLPGGNVPSVATGFGGGVGRSGGICGALTGAVMALGIKLCRKYAEESHLKSQANDGALKLVRGFEQQMGSTLCRDITGYVLCIPEQMERWKQERISETRCRKAIEVAVTLASGLLSQT
ncbi:MAG: C-GCAxxG-C-C family protein [Bacillota bacterium]